MTYRLLPVGDIHLAVREWASPNARPSLLLVHGLASNSLLWQGAAAVLVALGYHVIAIDQRGHGHSTKPDDGYDMSTVVDDLATLLEVLHLERPVVAGQSWGGNVVVDLAHRHPDLVRGICAVDGGLISLSERFGSWDECVEVLQPPRLAGVDGAAFERMLRRSYSGWPESAITGALGNMQRHDDGTMSPWLTFDRHLKVLRGLWEHTPHEIVAAIRCPVLFTPADSGDEWSRHKRDDYQRAMRQNERVRVEWFSPAHHDLHAQYPARWAAVLHEHIMNGFFS
ncbi:MAG: alpha/beta fold hydrolase [Ilumatobacteraceae bacterium]